MKCYKYNNIMNPSSKGLQFSQKHVLMQPYGICIVDMPHRPWVWFWATKIVPRSCMYLRLAQVMEVIIIDIKKDSQAHLWVIISN